MLSRLPRHARTRLRRSTAFSCAPSWPLLPPVDFLDAALARVQAELEQHLAPYAEALQLLQTIPGVKQTAAAAILAEIGADMTRFPSACAGQAPRLLGGPLPGQQAERRQADERG